MGIERLGKIHLISAMIGVLKIDENDINLVSSQQPRNKTARIQNKEVIPIRNLKAQRETLLNLPSTLATPAFLIKMGLRSGSTVANEVKGMMEELGYKHVYPEFIEVNRNHDNSSQIAECLPSNFIKGLTHGQPYPRFHAVLCEASLIENGTFLRLKISLHYDKELHVAPFTRGNRAITVTEICRITNILQNPTV